MTPQRILYVNQEITPYLEASYMSIIGRYLPQSIQEKGIDIRTFLPRYGLINERRNQLHEVIRLSGQNIIINDNDHPLTVKVASIQSIRMQTYFIDNMEFFHRKFMLFDQKDKFFPDNDERAIFYARGVLETVKNLGWSPDVIHCHGWISCLVPLFIRQLYYENPLFANAKIVFSIYNDSFSSNLNRSFGTKLKMCGISPKEAQKYRPLNYQTTIERAVEYSDAVVISENTVEDDIVKMVEKSSKPYFVHKEEHYSDDYLALYSQIMD